MSSPRPFTLFPYTTLFRSPCSTWTEPSMWCSSRRTRSNHWVGTLSPELFDSGVASVRGRPSKRSEEHTSELQSRRDLVCRLLLEKKKDSSFIKIILVVKNQ